MEEYEPVLRTPELGPGTMAEVDARGEPVVIVNLGQTYYALDGRCPRDGTRLGQEGRLTGHFLICPHDDSVYDVRTGQSAEHEGPGLQRYAVRIEENVIKVGPALPNGTRP
jgi:nitrite reductase/ring-hydroxylating ferredoxin subunit